VNFGAGLNAVGNRKIVCYRLGIGLSLLATYVMVFSVASFLLVFAPADYGNYVYGLINVSK
jgi:hypothetical protein